MEFTFKPLRPRSHDPIINIHHDNPLLQRNCCNKFREAVFWLNYVSGHMVIQHLFPRYKKGPCGPQTNNNYQNISQSPRHFLGAGTEELEIERQTLPSSCLQSCGGDRWVLLTVTHAWAQWERTGSQPNQRERGGAWGRESGRVFWKVLSLNWVEECGGIVRSNSNRRVYQTKEQAWQETKNSAETRKRW